MNIAFKDFEDDFCDTYPDDNFEVISGLIDNLLESSTPQIETAGEWVASSSIEKHDALNFTYYISLSKDDEEDGIELSFYTGIDVGCELVDMSFSGESAQYKPNMASVLDDLEIDWDKYPDIKDQRKVWAVFSGHKAKILDIYNKQNYDNYVTGGGTSVTDRAYKAQLDKYRDMGLHWKFVYRDIEADRNMV